MATPKNISDLFARAKFNPETGCWIWQGNLDTPGYGQTSFRYRGKVQGAHRVMYIMQHGGIPKNKWILHTCDNRACITPDHLFIGDNFSNQQDAARKGRCAGQNKTHCPQGHEYTKENTLIEHPAPHRNKRKCRICSNERRRRYFRKYNH